MPLPAILNTHRVVVGGQLPSGKRWANTLHYRWTGAGSAGSTNLNALEAEVYKLYAGPNYTGGKFFLDKARNTVSLDRIDITPLDGVSATLTTSHAAAGSSAVADSLPSEVAEVITLRTTLRGRRYRGRIYLFPWTEAQNTVDGTMQAVDRTDVLTNCAAHRTAVVALSWEPVVASYSFTVATPVVSYTMDAKFDSQRRRK